MRDGINDSQNLGRVHNLAFQGHSVKSYQAGDDCVEDAPLIREKLAPAHYTTELS